MEAQIALIQRVDLILILITFKKFILRVGKKGIKVDLKPGDMLVYSGCELEHWRNKFKGKECVQVFLHYNNRKTPGAKDNMFDKRPHLGLPSWFKR